MTGKEPMLGIDDVRTDISNPSEEATTARFAEVLVLRAGEELQKGRLDEAYRLFDKAVQQVGPEEADVIASECLIYLPDRPVPNHNSSHGLISAGGWHVGR